MPTSCAAIEDDPDLDDDEPPPVHLVVPASQCEPLRTKAPRSVFDLAVLKQLGRKLWKQPPVGPQHYRIERDCDRVRLVSVQAHETAEWRERERRRRAKQRPPPPTKRARTKGKKLQELVSVEFED